MRKILTILVLSLLTGIQASTAQTLLTDLPLKYRAQFPRTSGGKPPVIILLHGYGSNEQDLFGYLAKAFPAEYLVIAAQAPVRIAEDAYQWYDLNSSGGAVKYLDQSQQALLQFIPAVVRKYHADPQAVYLAGFSQGAVMSYQIGLLHPELLKGIGVWSGRMQSGLSKQVHNSAVLSRLRIFISHGTADQRIPYREATDALAFLQSIKLRPSFHSYNGVGHTIPPEMLRDFLQWLNMP